MNKLVSFENFIGQKAAQAAAAVREEQEEKRSSSANSFKALLAEYGVAEVAELTEDQRTEFFAKLRGAEVNESTFCASLEALNEAIKVSSKREANKVWNVYTKIFNEATALTTDKETHMGAIRQLFFLAMEDANFSREATAVMGLLKAPNRFKSFNVNVPELGNTAIQIGHSTINAYLETAYGRISSAGKWGGITIVEGTALYLDSIGMAGTGQALIDDFNRQFNESVVTEKKDELFTAYIEDKRKPGGSDKDIMDDYGLQVKNRDKDGFDVVGYKADIEAFAADHSIVLDEITVLESKVNEKLGDQWVAYIEDTRNPGGTDKEILKDYKLQVWNRTKKGFDVKGAKKDIEAFVADYDIQLEYGMELLKSKNESVVTEAEIKSDDEFKEYAFSVLKKAFGEDFDEAKATEVVDGILGKTKGDYAKAAGMLQSSLG